jgi:plasmid stabilization system protein ParE
MNYSLLLTNEALSDIEESYAWYETQQKGLGKEFSETTISYLEYISHNAHSHPKIRGEYRELVMRRFPYAIVYRIIKEKKVVVLGIIHTKKHPSSRKKRK